MTANGSRLCLVAENTRLTLNLKQKMESTKPTLNEAENGNKSKPLLPAVSLGNKKAKCYNCKHSGTTFKIAKVTHQHCEHPKYTIEMFESGELSAWDTLCTFSDTCKDHEFRPVK